MTPSVPDQTRDAHEELLAQHGEYWQLAHGLKELD